MNELIFLLDASDSMEDIKQQVVDGFNNMLKGRQETDIASLITFSSGMETRIDTIFERVPIGSIPQVTMERYHLNGATPLHEAICTTILHFRKLHNESLKDKRPSNVTVIILTDGQENASKRYKLHDAQDLINHQRVVNGWRFIFIGSEGDVYQTASRLGIEPKFALPFDKTSNGIAAVFNQATFLIEHKQEGGTIRL